MDPVICDGWMSVLYHAHLCCPGSGGERWVIWTLGHLECMDPVTP